MSKIIKIDVRYPNYGWTEVDIECVVAVLPAKRRVLFENMYWDLDEENFRILYNTWRGVDVSVEPESFEVKNGYYVCIDEGANNINAAVRFKVGGVYRYDDGMIVDGGTLGMSDDTVKKFFRPATEEETTHIEPTNNEYTGVPVEKVKLASEQDTSELTEFEEMFSSLIGALCGYTKGTCTDSYAKAHSEELLSIARKQLQPEFDKELERAYKNADEVQFQRGYEAGYNFAHQQVVDNNVSQEDVEQLVDEYQYDGHPCDFQVKAYKQGVERVVEFIKER